MQTASAFKKQSTRTAFDNLCVSRVLFDFFQKHRMKPAAIVVADEMFPEGVGPYMEIEEAGGSSALMMDLAANEKAVHADFFNDFDDMFDDDDLS